MAEAEVDPMSAADDTVPRFIAQVIAIVVASRLLGLLVRRIGQPMVIAEVTAGILLGPSLLGWLFPAVYSQLFAPESLDLVYAVSQLGLVLFMFLVGLELDPHLLRGTGRASVMVATASIVVPFVLGIVLAIYLYSSLVASGVPLLSFALFLGAAMSVTAFPVLARILAEKRLLRSRLGALALACAAVADVTAWCILAFVVAMARATGLRDAMHTTWMAAAYVAAMLWLVRPLFASIGARVGTAEALSQNVVAVVLLLLLASSWTTEWIGVHALFGAFVFGAVLPKSGGFARALTERIEELVLILLLPLFFAYSGLRTQIGLLDSTGAWATCLLIIAVACAGKFAASAAAARASGLAWREAGAIGVLMNTRGLMELIVLNIGLDLGVITPTLFTMMVLMALVTTFMATPLLQLIYPAVEPTPALVPEPEAAADRRQFTTLVCVADRRSGPGLITVARALQPQGMRSEIYALHVMPVSERGSLLFDRDAEQRGAGELRPLIERAQSLGVEVKALTSLSSNPAGDIGRVAEAKRADLILLGGHRPVLSRARLGGIVADVLKAARSDVGVLIDRGVSELKSILVLYRGASHDRTLLELAQRAVAAKITVLYPALEVSPEELGPILARDSGRAVELRGYDGTPTEAVLAEAARGQDLVIVGVGSDWDVEERGGGIRPERLIRECPASVLLVRHGYFRKAEGETR